MSNEPNFVASTHQGNITVKRSTREDHLVSMSPAESEKATAVIGSALSMVSLPHIPDHITNSPFVIRFFENKVLALERSDQRNSLPFRVNEGDELIKVIRLGLGMANNERAQGKVLPTNNQFIGGMVGDEPV